MREIKSRQRALPLTTISLCLAFVAAITTALPAQTFYGSVVGNITDPSGATVPGASVTLTNTGTTEKKVAVSDSNGNYQFVNLVPGMYQLDVELAGFKHLTRDQIQVRVESATRVNAVLEIGQVSETVEVSSQAPLLQTDSTSLGQIVEQRQVEDMPLNGRNILNLLGLVPGVVPQGSTSGNPVGNQNSGMSTNVWGWGNYQIGGGISNQNGTFIDGAPINMPPNNATVLVSTQDAIQEFNVATNNVSAEFGSYAGGIVNMTTKSGTNSFHGSAWEYLRNKVLNANDFFNNRNGVPRPPFTQNQYGASIMGPVIKNKTFFTFVWEGFNLRMAAPQTVTVPTQAMRDGNFAGFPTIYDPLTTCGQLGNPACATDANGAPIITRKAFANNVVPSNRFDPTTKAMLMYWGLPNRPGNTNNFVANQPGGGDNKQYNARIDHIVSDKQRIFGRYSYWGVKTVPGELFNNKTGGNKTDIRPQQLVLGDTYTFTPTMIGDFRFAYLRMYYGSFAPSVGTDMSQFGSGWAKVGTQMPFPAYPGETITGGFRGQGGLGQLTRDNDYSFLGSLTKIMGRHTLKFGGSVRRDVWSFISMFPVGGAFNFDATMTSANATNTTASGYGFASFLLGYPTLGSLPTGNTVYQVLNSMGWYVADTFQFSPKVTLNLGLRWDQPGAFKELHDNHAVLLPDVKDPLSDKVGMALKGKLALVDSTDWPHREEQKLHWSLFSPRIGLSYRLTDRWVIRTGYGISYLPYSVAQNGPNVAAVNLSTTTMTTSLNGGLTPYNVMSNPFPDGLIMPAGRTPGFLDTLVGKSVTLPDPDQNAPYVQQWNFNIQRELGFGSMFQIGYAGSKGTHLPISVPNSGVGVDQLSPQYFSLGSALNKQVPNPFYGTIPTSAGVLGQKTVAQGYLLRPFPQYLNLMVPQKNAGVSSYHALQTTFQKRFAGGGNIIANYTWSKILSNTDTVTGYLERAASGSSNVGIIQDWTNLGSEKSLISQDVPHRFVVSYVYDLPIGKGKKLASGATGVTDKLISGWSFNGSTTFQKGYPVGFITLTNGLAPFGVGTFVSGTGTSGTIRPDVVAGCNPVLEGSAQSRLNKWFETSCYVQPGNYSLGNASRTDPKLRTHGVNNWDLGVSKAIPITEVVRLNFYTQFFNLMNRVQFLPPTSQVGNPNFGRITAAQNQPRLIQFGLRLAF